jgi:predicted GIY-YIG superfamily endonuclease
MKGIVYVLMCNLTGKKYYGSTTKSLSERMRQHFSSNNKCSSREITNSCNISIQILVEQEFSNINDLLKIEGEYIRNNICVNRVTIGLSKEEQKERNLEKQRQKQQNSIDIYCLCGKKVKDYCFNSHKQSVYHLETMYNLHKNIPEPINII